MRQNTSICLCLWHIVNTLFPFRFQVQGFFAKFPEAGAGTRARDQCLEQIQANIAWMDANERVITEWIKANIPSTH